MAIFENWNNPEAHSPLSWSPQQAQALKKVADWIRDPNAQQVFYLAGYAGTGKTTLAQHLVEAEAPGRWLYAAYTGKAAHVMAKKGCHGASTIHSLIYRPTELPNGEVIFELNLESALCEPGIDGIVVDEVSMVDWELGQDLEQFGKKILVIGDPAQLPPVKGGGYFTKREPDVMLTEIHRQAAESGILRLATHVRQGGHINAFRDGGADVIFAKADDGSTELMMGCDQILVGRNNTRMALNWNYRELAGIEDELPVVRDRLVCLRNDKMNGTYNGSQWVAETAQRVDEWAMAFRLKSEDTGREVSITSWLHHFKGEEERLRKMGPRRRDMGEFDWGYALTVHKAQGSQWNAVALVDESFCFREDRHRWLYTGITRAAERLVVLR